MIKLDGSYLEGGGQIVRTALALSTITQKGFEVDKIRLGRPKPGLKMQHMHCIEALQDLCNAKAEGAELGSVYLKYEPGKIEAKTLDIDIGTAGSITLLLQSLLIPCFFAEKIVNLNIIGGTDTKWSMPVDYLKEVLLPQLKKYADINLKLEKRGYYPKGGGKVSLKIKPKYSLETISDAKKIDLVEQGNLMQIKGVSHASENLQMAKVAERQADSAKNILNKFKCPIDIATEYPQTFSSGTGIILWAKFANKQGEIDYVNPVILGADGLGEKGKRAEIVGQEAAQKLAKEIESNAPVDRHLADNLLPFMALNTPSKIKVSEITNHCKTNMYVIEKFLPVKFKIKDNLIECVKLN
jgi:RNA 3'-phosphate cyclase